MKKKIKISTTSPVSNKKLRNGIDNIKFNDPDDKAKSTYIRKDASTLQLFRFSTCLDIFTISIGIVTSAISGFLYPFMFMIFGEVTGSLIEFALVQHNKTVSEEIYKKAEEKFMEDVTSFAINTSIYGLLTIIFVYISCWMINFSCIRQVSKIRSKYMESVLNKDVSWYDVNQTGDFASRVTEDISKIEEALGDKFSTFIFYVSIFWSGLIMSFIKGWQLSLICLIYLPVSSITLGLVTRLSNKVVNSEMDAYGSAGAVAEEVFGAVRTVIAFDGQQKEIDRYKQFLNVAKNSGIKRAIFAAISNGTMWLFVYGSYGLSFYYGVGLIINERSLPIEEQVYTPGNMITVFFGVLIATWNYGLASPYIQSLSVAKAAATKIFNVIDELPTINLSKENGKKYTTLTGNILFKGVHFHYPSRPDVKILQGLDLKINAGESVALVGSSGCGKSTCIQLIQRFYDSLKGNVTIDGIDIRNFDLKWLRNKIGYVGQEPILFATTIQENIRYGNPMVSQEDIEIAAKKANAHEFIKRLPQGYDTLVGERGAQLSGGQKQRIAIARALVRNPFILLLDEATSALDTSSEAQVQAALDSASIGCTTIIVAHRLSTIRGANRIVVISEGKAIEEGSHKKLMQLKGAYYNLVTAQTSNVVENKENDDQYVTFGSPEQDANQKLSIISANEAAPEIIQKDNIKVFKTIGDILIMNKPEWFYIFLASIGAAVSGASLPMFSIVFGDIVGILAMEDNVRVREEGNKLCLYFTIIGIITGVATFIQFWFFGISGEKLTMRVRSKMFATMLTQEMGWYDKKENGTGALCAKLSADASGVQGASGQTIGTVVNSLSNLILSIGVAFYFEWRITLVIIVFVPLIFFAIYFEQKVINAETIGSKNAIEESTKIAVEAISNIRTVASLGCEKTFQTLYVQALGPHYTRIKKNTHVRGLVMGLARSMLFFSYAVAVYYGGTLMRDEKLDHSIVLKVAESIALGAWALGNALAYSPNFQKGIESASKLMKLIRRSPSIRDNKKATSLSWVNSSIKYNNIKFSYPTRPALTVLRELNLSIFHGKTVALVGPSGCGKSTIIQLLERFYDPLGGNVTIDDTNLRSIRLSSLRSHLGIVSQEPNLFDRTIAENIAYGDNNRKVRLDEIIDAAKNANIHTFITSLPQGYETRLGEKGTQLSGGQKQRIAIARALVRNPQVLLLDEATSALDTESEKVVQEALDKAKAGRTCITIAHRLLTIQDADVICVIDKGKVTELGTHSELLALKGLYHKLYSMQMAHR